ncbi:MAG: potassium-transporting ATPase subunit KdpA, partial [Thermoleophilia bacterium]|nr:potassium-transporting ATPase subunit KdpA [Thermoleophilia bacterium]
MTSINILEIVLFVALVLVLAAPLGLYLKRIFNREKTFLDPVFLPIERLIFKATGVDPEQEMGWKEYALSVMAFNFIGILFLFVILLAQGALPLNPQELGGLSWHLAFNTAASFITNTNWQSYVGEATMSYLSQMLGLATQNFLSAATGISVMLALTRGLTRKSSSTIGNFWSDLTRSTLWVLLPLALIIALLMVSQGVVQNFSPSVTAETLEGSQQVISMGPVASQEAIKELGTNGGGFFNANSAHPFENPTPFSNLLQMLSILLIPVALTFTYGRMTGRIRQGYVILGAMMILFLAGLAVNVASEHQGNPQIAALGVASPTAMEGKEVRFGITESSLFSTITTDTSTGAVNSMHDSFTPLGGLVPMVNMMLGEVIFGGVGCGLYGILIFVILTVFIVGLMVGRTPEYLGKKIESFEIKMAIMAVLIPSAVILLFTALAVVTEQGKAGILNPGAHGFSEILYAFSSAAGNNGSAFAGLSADSTFYNISLGLVMLIGRFWMMLPVLAIAGSLAGKKLVP